MRSKWYPYSTMGWDVPIIPADPTQKYPWYSKASLDAIGKKYGIAYDLAGMAFEMLMDAEKSGVSLSAIRQKWIDEDNESLENINSAYNFAMFWKKQKGSVPAEFGLEFEKPQGGGNTMLYAGIAAAAVVAFLALK